MAVDPYPGAVTPRPMGFDPLGEARMRMHIAAGDPDLLIAVPAPMPGSPHPGARRDRRHDLDLGRRNNRRRAWWRLAGGARNASAKQQQHCGGTRKETGREGHRWASATYMNDDGL